MLNMIGCTSIWGRNNTVDQSFKNVFYTGLEDPRLQKLFVDQYSTYDLSLTVQYKIFVYCTIIISLLVEINLLRSRIRI